MKLFYFTTPEPVPEQMPNVETVTKAMIDTEQTIHPESVAPEPTRPSDTPILDSTPTEPNILHIFNTHKSPCWLDQACPVPQVCHVLAAFDDQI